LTLVTDAIGATNAYTFDVRGFKRTSNEADRGAWTYTFNSLGELVSQTDAKSQTTTMVYDGLSRMTSRTEAEGTSTWTYGVLADNSATNKYIGRLKSLAGPGR
jgi:YD repeat-containing protein